MKVERIGNVNVKKGLRNVFLFFNLFTFLFCASVAYAGDGKKQSTVQTVTFSVNMHCENCKKKIEGTVGWEKGVKDLKANLNDKTVTIKYDSSKTTPEKLQQGIKKLGYSAEKVEKVKKEK